ncbi:tyrosine-type recombinase/integrase [Evansella halocellulosilytica]|uniref:tyrosine-type recombinase/integrase n=1 Tax=Evansella halocellulosilytica TaxID=2011013 RepID=UPI00211C0551|nr:tyrosine-type recombinase/integrase [Evansella halocellulosilytica]
MKRNELNKLIREVDRTGNNRNIAIIMLLVNTGVRLQELVSLNKEDIEMTERKGQVTIRNGKGNKERVIPLNAEARRAIRRYLADRMDNESPLFLSTHGKRISPRAVQHLLKKFGYNVHSLRHTFITTLVRNNEDFSLIQSLSGHSSTDMVTRYSLADNETKEIALEKLM